MEERQVKGMMKYYLFTTYNDKGNVNGWIRAQDEMDEEDWNKAASRYVQYDGYDLYVDEYDSMDEALEALEEARNA